MIALGLLDSAFGDDLVLTGEGRFDWASLRDSVAAGAARAAGRLGRPAVVLAGQVQVGRRETMAAGVAGASTCG